MELRKESHTWGGRGPEGRRRHRPGRGCRDIAPFFLARKNGGSRARGHGQGGWMLCWILVPPGLARALGRRWASLRTRGSSARGGQFQPRVPAGLHRHVYLAQPVPEEAAGRSGRCCARRPVGGAGAPRLRGPDSAVSAQVPETARPTVPAGPPRPLPPPSCPGDTLPAACP